MGGDRNEWEVMKGSGNEMGLPSEITIVKFFVGGSHSSCGRGSLNYLYLTQKKIPLKCPQGQCFIVQFFSLYKPVPENGVLIRRGMGGEICIGGVYLKFTLKTVFFLKSLTPFPPKTGVTAAK